MSSGGPRIGRCIYCDAPRYSHDRDRLGREHVIPRGLGGRWTVLDAVCQQCENAINHTAEEIVQKETFDILRRSLRLSSKSKDGPGLDEMVLGMTYDRKIWFPRRVSVDEMPIYILAPDFGSPNFLSKKNYTKQSENIKFYQVLINPDKIKKLCARHQVEAIRLPKFYLSFGPFVRIIAKIAHSFTVYSFRSNEIFTPYLRRGILGSDENIPLSHYIGTNSGVPPGREFKLRHHLNLSIMPGDNGANIICVRVSLFRDLCFPSYTVIVGHIEDKEIAKLPQNNKAEFPLVNTV